jgi:hypothetical protein
VVDSATNDDIARRGNVSNALYTSDVLDSISAETSPNVEDLNGATQTPNHMEESPDNLEECGYAVVSASSDLIRYVSVGIEEDYICEVCQGSQKTCDCSLRQLIKRKRETSDLEKLIYPSYLFFPPFYFGKTLKALYQIYGRRSGTCRDGLGGQTRSLARFILR